MQRFSLSVSAALRRDQGRTGPASKESASPTTGAGQHSRSMGGAPNTTEEKAQSATQIHPATPSNNRHHTRTRISRRRASPTRSLRPAPQTGRSCRRFRRPAALWLPRWCRGFKGLPWSGVPERRGTCLTRKRTSRSWCSGNGGATCRDESK